eukprot:jgi/Psemu1/292587/fgenesh1_pg.1142_\
MSAPVDDDDHVHHYFDPQTADSVLARDLNRMTNEQRDDVFEDIHGVRRLRAEETTPAIMLQSLERMNVAILQINRKVAFDEACRLHSQFVLRDKQFRMKFLRAEEYDVNRAAQRFVNYLDFSYQHFGTAALMRPIYIDDLTKEEQNMLRDGCQQLLPCRDRTGRMIICRVGNMGGAGESQTTPTRMRVNWYLLQQLSSDETTQQFGCVFILFSNFEKGETNFLKEPGITETVRKLHAASPVRFGAIHLCLPNTPTYQFAAAAVSLISPTFMRVRVRKHFGSLTECRYSLMAYGIPSDQLPVTASGRIKTTNHLRWIKAQKEREDTIQMGLPPFEGIDCPRVMDILIGNAGHSFRNNPGNIIYRDVMESYFEKYESASDTQEKTRITWKVLEELTKAGGRILVRSRRGWWSVASADKAREKISHDFREARKRLHSAKKRSQMDTSAIAFTRLNGKRTRVGGDRKCGTSACRDGGESESTIRIEENGGCINLCSNKVEIAKLV